MPKPKSIIPAIKLNLSLPIDVRTKMDLHLYSSLEQRVPLGAYRAFIIDRLNEYFEHQHLDLAPFSGSMPGSFIVSGPPGAIAALEKTLKGEVPV